MAVLKCKEFFEMRWTAAVRTLPLRRHLTGGLISVEDIEWLIGERRFVIREGPTCWYSLWRFTHSWFASRCRNNSRRRRVFGSRCPKLFLSIPFDPGRTCQPRRLVAYFRRRIEPWRKWSGILISWTRGCSTLWRYFYTCKRKRSRIAWTNRRWIISISKIIYIASPMHFIAIPSSTTPWYTLEVSPLISTPPLIWYTSPGTVSQTFTSYLTFQVKVFQFMIVLIERDLSEITRFVVVSKQTNVGVTRKY